MQYSITLPVNVTNDVYIFSVSNPEGSL